MKWYDKSSAVAFEGGHFPYRQNYLDLDPTYTDKFGDPLIRLTLDWTDHERAQTNMAIKAGSAIARAMGGKVARSAEWARGIRLRSIRARTYREAPSWALLLRRSVLNPWLQHWQMPNLWMTGGSTFPQSGSGNPTLTIIAMTYRAADALIDRYSETSGYTLMKRRRLLTVPAKSLDGLLLYTLAGEPVRLPAAENGKVRIPLLFFTRARHRQCRRRVPDFPDRRERSGGHGSQCHRLHRPATGWPMG